MSLSGGENWPHYLGLRGAVTKAGSLRQGTTVDKWDRKVQSAGENCLQNISGKRGKPLLGEEREQFSRKQVLKLLISQSWTDYNVFLSVFRRFSELRSGPKSEERGLDFFLG